MTFASETNFPYPQNRHVHLRSSNWDSDNFYVQITKYGVLLRICAPRKHKCSSNSSSVRQRRWSWKQNQYKWACSGQRGGGYDGKWILHFSNGKGAPPQFSVTFPVHTFPAWNCNANYISSLGPILWFTFFVLRTSGYIFLRIGFSVPFSGVLH